MATAELANVQRWYDTRGQGDPLVALHPGGTGVDSPALHPNVEALSQHFQVYAPEQLGHRHTPDVEGPITFELMAQDTIMFIETVIGRPVHVLGCSDGAVLGTIACRTLVMVADDEVRLEHAVDLYRSLSDAELSVQPHNHGSPELR
jgi:pimeloyl-ACP methyl ester carboxylesterase